MDKAAILEAALACGEWLLRNQVSDRGDANRGRGIRCFDLKSGYKSLTGNWQTGVQCMALCALYRRTGDDRYRRAAELAGRYLLSLQILDQREERYYGVFREVTPQTMEYAPRDATTAAWALVWLYHATKNPLYLDRAILFGKWHMRFAMQDGWPMWTCFMDQCHPNMYWAGSFQSGTGLFYYDLFMASDDMEFVARGLRPIAAKYRDEFFEPGGKIIYVRDGFTGQVLYPDFGDMHLYNDDFGNAMLQQAADFFKDESYREAARKNALWLARQQREDGGYDPRYPSGVPVSLMYFHDLGTHYNDPTLLAARDKALKKLLAMQYRGIDPRVDGAFKGVYEGPTDFPGGGDICVNTRCTGYSLMALLKLESDVKDIWLGRFNRPFVDGNATDGEINLTW